MRTDSLPGRRASGLLLHPTSLPGGLIGDLGEAAYRFVDWIAAAGQSYWQILPLVSVDSGGSPYNGLSAMAGNPLLISPLLLERDGLLDAGWALDEPGTEIGHVDFAAATKWKSRLLDAAYETAIADGARWVVTLNEFKERHRGWLPDYALFRALRSHHGGAPWSSWPEPFKRRDQAVLGRAREQFASEIDHYVFQEFVFESQWQALHGYANSKGIRIIGDIPIFVAYDSADVWAHPEIFQLDGDGMPTVVAGVPPDYFSATGQRWGNPLYRWDLLADRRFDWWVDRFHRTFELVDVARIDHFRGFEAYWEIPEAEKTAVHGRWVAGPGADFFRVVENRLGALPLIAEDLGLITPAVDRMREELGYPGMRVLQFGFDGDSDNPHRPENFPESVIAYTGTHDNDTIDGWWAAAGPAERLRVFDSLGGPDLDNWSFIQAVMASHAEVSIVPMQDLLSLGSEARMNTPGEGADNWSWRMTAMPPPALADRLRQLTLRTGRARSERGSLPADSNAERT